MAADIIMAYWGIVLSSLAAAAVIVLLKVRCERDRARRIDRMLEDIRKGRESGVR